MTQSSIANEIAAPAVDLDALIVLATHHLTHATNHAVDKGELPGVQAVHLTEYQSIFRSVEERAQDDLILARELIGRSEMIFAAGVDLGIAIAAAVISRPLGNPGPLWADALETAKDELHQVVMGACNDAGNAKKAQAKAAAATRN